MNVLSVTFQGNKKPLTDTKKLQKALKDHTPYNAPMAIIAENKNSYARNPLEPFIASFVDSHMNGASSQEVFEKALRGGNFVELYQEIQNNMLHMNQGKDRFIRGCRLAIKKYVSGVTAGVTKKRAIDATNTIKEKITIAQYNDLLKFINKASCR